MTTSEADPSFVDTNLLIYANVPAAPEHKPARERLERLADGGTELWISRQVLREYAARMTRPQTFSSPLPATKVTSDVRRFEAEFSVAEDGPLVTIRLLELLEAVPMGGKQVHDANLVATMLVHGIHRLITNNVADFVRFARWIDVVPLLSAP